MNRTNSTNWGKDLTKPYQGDVTAPSTLIYFWVLYKKKAARVGIKPEHIDSKTADWDSQRLGYKRLSK